MSMTLPCFRVVAGLKPPGLSVLSGLFPPRISRTLPVLSCEAAGGPPPGASERFVKPSLGFGLLVLKLLPNWKLGAALLSTVKLFSGLVMVPNISITLPVFSSEALPTTKISVKIYNSELNGGLNSHTPSNEVSYLHIHCTHEFLMPTGWFGQEKPMVQIRVHIYSKLGKITPLVYPIISYIWSELEMYLFHKQNTIIQTNEQLSLPLQTIQVSKNEDKKSFIKNTYFGLLF